MDNTTAFVLFMVGLFVLGFMFGFVACFATIARIERREEH